MGALPTLFWPRGPHLPRLAAAFGASLGLHALVGTALDALPYGGGFSISPAASRSLRAVLRATQDTSSEAEALSGAARAPGIEAATPSRQAGNRGASKVPGLPTPYYYRAQELDVRPGITAQVEPEYPQRAALRNVSGRVMILLYVNESGSIDKTEIVRADPPGYFEAAAEQAFRAARFTPAMKDGRPARARVLMEVAFDSPQPPAEILVR